MRRAVMTLLAMFTGPATAAEPPRTLDVGIVIPQRGPFAVYGAHVREAFTAWQAAHPGIISDLVEGEDGCDAISGADAASAMTEAGVDIVIGFVCTESLAAALPILSDEGIPTMTLSIRADIMAEEARRFGWSFYRLAPRAGQEAEIAADAIFALWADKPFAIVEDGTIEGRELAEAVRIDLEERGLKPSFVDNYRPGQTLQPSLIRRLKAAGVEKVFVGGDRSDLAIIAREATEQRVPLRFMGGDALNAAVGDVPIPEGTLAVVATAALAGGATIDARESLARLGLAPEGFRLPAYAAADILGAVATRMDFDDLPLTELLSGRRFGTAIGPVTFGPDGERLEPGFSLAIWRGGSFERISPRQVLDANDSQ